MSEDFPLIEVEVQTKRRPASLPVCPWVFPDCAAAPAGAPVAAGGDYHPATVVAAYRAGAFPWPQGDDDYLWFSPDPRAVLPLDGFHLSRRLARTLRAGRFRVTVDASFDRVIDLCSSLHADSWITPALKRGYRDLHHLGWAHSFEVWDSAGELVGGLYGLAVGALYGAESMFHLATDASKVAVAAMVQHAGRIGVEVIDIQVLNPHTASLGGVEIPRRQYLEAVRRAVGVPVDWAAPRKTRTRPLAG